jgi:hypothetical protein
MTNSNILDSWQKRKCVIATMHGKEKVIAPLLLSELGIETIVPTNFNTDKFGTFTRDVTRAGNQLEAARQKALAAMEHTGLDLAIASEGSFGLHPHSPFVASNLELVLLLDKLNDIEVVGHFRTSEVKVLGQNVSSPAEAVATATTWGFPAQGVILRLSEKSNRHIYKDNTSIPELEEVSQKLLSGLFTKTIFIETDMRAHRCPARQKSIEAGTLDLIKNCQSLCPKCTTPGFVVTDVIKGLPCNYCGLPTDQAKALVYSCQKCDFSEERMIEVNPEADQGECARCNP